MNTSSNKRTILLVCTGNTCRSPMAEVILQQKLKALGKIDEFEVDSAARSGQTGAPATEYAREAIRKMFGEDLLASHTSKELTDELKVKADLILVMAVWMKAGLPPKKTWTLKEYAGGSGDVADPIGQSFNVYQKCADEISGALDGVVKKLI